MLAGVTALLVAVNAYAAWVITREKHAIAAGNIRPSGIPGNISTSLANMMQLSPVPHAAAPGFTLTDQAAHPLSRARLRGTVVVLEFMDPHCTDICPIMSQEFVDAY